MSFFSKLAQKLAETFSKKENAAEPEPIAIIELELDDDQKANLSPPPDLSFIDKCLTDEIESKGLKFSRFTQLVAEALPRLDSSIQIKSVADGTIEWTTAAGGQGLDNLHNIWRGLKDEAGKRKELGLRNSLNSTLKLVRGERTITAEDVVAVVRNYGVTLNVREAQGGTEAEPQLRLAGKFLAPGLDLLFAQDTPTDFTMMDIEEVESIESDMDILLNKALFNLIAKVNLPVKILQPPSGFFMPIWGGNYEASLILIPEVMETLEEMAEGDLIFSVPCRDLLFLTSETYENAVEVLSEQALKMYNTGSYQISPHIYRWKKESIELLKRN